MRKEAVSLVGALARNSSQQEALEQVRFELNAISAPLRRDTAAALQKSLVLTRDEKSVERISLSNFAKKLEDDIHNYYDSELVSVSPHSPLKVAVVPPAYSTASPVVMGFEVLNAAFDVALAREPRLVAFGEDLSENSVMSTRVSADCRKNMVHCA